MSFVVFWRDGGFYDKAFSTEEAAREYVEKERPLDEEWDIAWLGPDPKDNRLVARYPLEAVT